MRFACDVIVTENIIAIAQLKFHIINFYLKITGPPLRYRENQGKKLVLPIGFMKAHRQSYDNVIGSDNSFFNQTSRSLLYQRVILIDRLFP